MSDQEYSLTVKSAQSIHQLHAIRMRWLKWLSRPIVAVWNFISDCLSFVWNDLILLSYEGMKESFNHRYWAVSSAGLFVAFFLIIIFSILSLKTGNVLFYFAGALLAVLPVSWANAEIAGILEVKKNTGVEPELKEIPSQFGLGLKTVLLLSVFVGIILIMTVLQGLLDLAGLIPHAGFTLLGILAVPIIAASAVILFALIIIAFGTPILGPHLLENYESYKSFPRRVFDSSVSLIQFISHKWIDIFLISIPASFFAAVVSFIPAAILSASAGISYFIATGTLNFFESGFSPALQFMSLSSPESGIMSYVSGFFWSISISLLMAFAFSFSHASIASTFFHLYYRTSSMNFIKKIFGIIFMFLILFFSYRALRYAFGLLF